MSIVSDDASNRQFFLDKNIVIGCISIEAYKRNKVVCLKKYINLVLQPIHLYIGTYLLIAIHAVSKQLAAFSNEDIIYFSNKLNFQTDTNNLKLKFTENLEFMINSFPSQEYINLKQLHDLNQETPEVLGLQGNENLINKLNILETSFIEFRRKIIVEIQENEDGVNKVLSDLSLIKPSLNNKNLEILQNKIESLDIQINNIISRLDSFPEMSLIEKALFEIQENELDFNNLNT